MNTLASHGKRKLEVMLFMYDDELLDEVMKGLKEFFSRKGLKTFVGKVHEQVPKKVDFDLVFHFVEWSKSLIDVSVFDNDGLTHNLKVDRTFRTTESILDQIQGYVEGLQC